MSPVANLASYRLRAKTRRLRWLRQCGARLDLMLAAVDELAQAALELSTPAGDVRKCGA